MIIKLTGTLTPLGTLTGTLTLEGQLVGTIQRVSGGEYVPYYEGAYEVTPKSIEQVLKTAGLRMQDDVTVFEIPYAETSNPQGGYTVTIGG